MLGVPHRIRSPILVERPPPLIVGRTGVPPLWLYGVAPSDRPFEFSDYVQPSKSAGVSQCEHRLQIGLGLADEIGEKQPMLRGGNVESSGSAPQSR